ncbi:DUF4286 family protein [Bordetella genomosp. 12]|uniref:ABM domain-containing protein n=1 Tax=Bordetella genomosp. 12 TaxID=463035 RepID=A0A261VP66_9BORD|nr:DUF4286 family protein [Bordetella genomosp. 12]OZI74993.1 hypothetical protein CAL22_11305 [Bordetella genomosp. 12]
MSMQTLLLRIMGQALDEAAAQDLRGHMLAACPQARVEIHVAVDAQAEFTYVYCSSASPQGLAAMRALVDERYPGAQTRVLDLLTDLAGRSDGQGSGWHYVVETDVLPEMEADFNAWYEQEHLPGLASVPGTVQARRWRCHDGSPRYHAAYELVTPETFGSEPWLAVRGSDWSSRVRPAFRNTRRTMFRKLAG